jgi:TPR repeat protein
VAITNRIIAKDTTAVDAALAAAQVLITPPASAKPPAAPAPAPAPAAGTGTTDTTAAGAAPVPGRGRPKEALPFLEFAIRYGDAQAKENAAALLYTGAAPLLQQPQDLAGAAELLRLAAQTANPTGKVYPAANYLLGLATLFQVPQIDPQAEKQKSCDLSKQMEGLLAQADTALTAGRTVNQEAADKNLGIIKQYKPRVASMLKAYCK